MPKAVVLAQYGPSDVLLWKDVVMPEPGPGQVRIRVKAAGVGPTDLKIRRGDQQAVIGAAAPRDHDLVRDLGGVPVTYGPGLADRVGDTVPSVDAALDAAGKGELPDAIALAGDPARVMTVADEHAADLGVVLPVPTPDRTPEALEQSMPFLASGALHLRRQRHLPMEHAAQAHRLLENGEAHEKLILEAR